MGEVHEFEPEEVMAGREETYLWVSIGFSSPDRAEDVLLVLVATSVDDQDQAPSATTRSISSGTTSPSHAMGESLPSEFREVPSSSTSPPMASRLSASPAHSASSAATRSRATQRPSESSAKCQGRGAGAVSPSPARGVRSDMSSKPTRSTLRRLASSFNLTADFGAVIAPAAHEHTRGANRLVLLAGRSQQRHTSGETPARNAI